MVTTASNARVEAAAKAPVTLKSLNSSSICSGSVLVWPRIAPETTDTAPNSPMTRALHNTAP